jgi:hypothetical protein
MIIAIVLWSIKKGSEDEFIKKWKEEFCVPDRTNLIGEFLSKPIDTIDPRLKTLRLDNIGDQPAADKTILMNVGMWVSEADFHNQVGQFMKSTDNKKRDFECEVRTRVLLQPLAWRLGDSLLPKHDSGKTF